MGHGLVQDRQCSNDCSSKKPPVLGVWTRALSLHNTNRYLSTCGGADQVYCTDSFCSDSEPRGRQSERVDYEPCNTNRYLSTCAGAALARTWKTVLQEEAKFLFDLNRYEKKCGK